MQKLLLLVGLIVSPNLLAFAAPAPALPGKTESEGKPENSQPKPVRPSRAIVQPNPMSAGVTLRQAGAPPAPVLVSPTSGETINDRSVAFAWEVGQGLPAAEYFILCVVEVEKNCSQPGAKIYENLPANSQRFSPPDGLPLRLQGRRLHWSVAACATDSNARTNRLGTSPIEKCTFALTRGLTWNLPGPQLARPSGQLRSMRPNFVWQNVVGATSYRLCVSQRGVACPINTTDLPGTLVVAIDGAPIYTPPNSRELARFTGQRVYWTVAACNEQLGCRYQRQVRDIVFPAPVHGRVPGAPQLLGPPDGSEVRGEARRQVFTWTEVADAFSYKLCVAPQIDQCGTANAFEQPGIRTSSYPARVPVAIAEEGAGTQWSVAACNQDNHCGPYGGFRTVIIRADAPEPPVLSTPRDEVLIGTTDRDVLFSWSADRRATSYLLCVAQQGVECGEEKSTVWIVRDLQRAIRTIPFQLFRHQRELQSRLEWTVAACIGNECSYQSERRNLVKALGAKEFEFRNSLYHTVITKQERDNGDREHEQGDWLPGVHVCIGPPLFEAAAQGRRDVNKQWGYFYTGAARVLPTFVPAESFTITVSIEGCRKNASDTCGNSIPAGRFINSYKTFDIDLRDITSIGEEANARQRARGQSGILWEVPVVGNNEGTEPWCTPFTNAEIQQRSVTGTQ